jgi:hypothetical protein
MEVWTWIVAYIVGFSLLQLLVYRYVRDREASGTAPRGAETYSAPLDQTERAPGARSEGDEGTHCPQCGAFNEGNSYQYCRACVSPLR